MTSLSPPPDARSWPSGLKASEETPMPWAEMVANSLFCSKLQILKISSAAGSNSLAIGMEDYRANDGFMPAEVMQLLAGAGVPDLYKPIGRSCDDAFAFLVESAGHHRPFVPGQGADFRALVTVPEFQEIVAAAGEERLPSGLY